MPRRSNGGGWRLARRCVMVPVAWSLLTFSSGAHAQGAGVVVAAPSSPTAGANEQGAQVVQAAGAIVTILDFIIEIFYTVGGVQDDERISALRQAADALDRRLESVENNIADLRGDIADVRGDIADLRGDVDDIRGDVNDIRGDIGAIRTQLDRIEGRLPPQ